MTDDQILVDAETAETPETAAETAETADQVEVRRNVVL